MQTELCQQPQYPSPYVIQGDLTQTQQPLCVRHIAVSHRHTFDRPVKHFREDQALEIGERQETADLILRKTGAGKQTVSQRLAKRHRHYGESGPRTVSDETRQRDHLSN